MRRYELVSRTARQGKILSVDTLEFLARAGLLTKGVLYMIVGVLALEAAAGIGGRVTGARGALLTVLQQPFGRTLVLLAGIGLFGYGAWRILEGALDSNNLGRDWRALSLRVSYVARGVLHGAFGIQAFRLYAGLSSSGTSEREFTAEALRWPFGDWLVVLGGLGLIGFAVQQVYAAVKSRLEPRLDASQLRREVGAWAVNLSRFGIAARAVVFGMFGYFIVNAGWTRDPSQVGSTASSMRAIANQAGTLGLGITAAGLIGYGFYQIMHTLYLRMGR